MRPKVSASLRQHLAVLLLVALATGCAAGAPQGDLGSGSTGGLSGGGVSGSSTGGVTSGATSGTTVSSTGGDHGSPPFGQIVVMAQLEASLGEQGYEIATLDLDGGRFTRLTDNALEDFQPHFSPDGTRLVFTRFTSGAEDNPPSTTEVMVYDLATQSETQLTHGGRSYQPVWSPDGSRIAFLDLSTTHLWLMNADGSSPTEIAGPSGAPDDRVWGDIAWSSDDWISLVVAQALDSDAGGCVTTRTDKIRPDGTARTKVSAGGPPCTGKGQTGDADPSFSADAATLYSSRGFQMAAEGAPSGVLERKLFSFSSAAWFLGKPEVDLSLPAEPSCVEGIPKGSPDGRRILLFRRCFDVAGAPGGVFLTDSAGSYRTLILANGSGADWNPLGR